MGPEGMIDACVTEKPVDEGPKGPIRALYRWLKGTSPGIEQGQPSALQPLGEKLARPPRSLRD